MNNYKEKFGSFPFGQPIMKVYQKDRTSKKVFVLGVYASAVHARWVDEQGKTLIKAIAVASEPEIFWRGENAGEIIDKISIPTDAGKLVAADDKLNGPSGVTLDDSYLKPLGLTRSEVWLCDLIPHSFRNERQRIALEKNYDPKIDVLKLPAYKWEAVPSKLADESRQKEILNEIALASPSVIITLGDQPLKWFTSKYGSKSRLVEYGKPKDNSYGLLHDIIIDGRAIKLLPLVHPRQAGRLGGSSPEWAECHDKWIKSVASGLLRG
jgi:uracil-DNA glycosylase